MLQRITAFLLLLIISPILLVIVILLRFTGEGEILYLQLRSGINGEVFKIYKFATMLKNSPNMKNADVTIKGDERVLFIGYYLRKLKINEILQLINVFKGEMVFVGPRPLTPKQIEKVPDSLKNKINYLKPGITGVSSLIFRNEEELLSNDSPLEMHKKLTLIKYNLESWYGLNKNILLDFLIVILTVISIVFPSLKLYKIFKKIWNDFPNLIIEEVFEDYIMNKQ